MGNPWMANAAEEGWFYLFPPNIVLDSIEAPGTSGKDVWGVYWHWPEVAPGPHPSSEKKDLVITDITKWKEQWISPSYDQCDWNEITDFVSKIDRDKYLVTVVMYQGIFERGNMLLGFENGLTALYTNPDEMYELYSSICDIKIKQFDEIYDRLHPDMIHHHDDWGMRNALFVAPEIWRKIIKPHYQRFYDHIKNKSVLISHHADSYLVPIIEDMIDLGIDIWQGVLAENNIPEIKKQIAGRMTLMGGINSSIVNQVGISEERIREEVRRCVNEYCPGGYFIPCVTSESAFSPDIDKIIIDELEKCNISSYQTSIR